MNQETLLELSKTIDCKYEIGIWSEINSFMEYQEDKILKYNLSFEDIENKFYLKIEMKSYDKDEADYLFESFVSFIEYSNATFYVRKTNNKKSEYYLLSSTNSGKGFLINVIIT